MHIQRDELFQDLQVAGSYPFKATVASSDRRSPNSSGVSSGHDAALDRVPAAHPCVILTRRAAHNALEGGAKRTVRVISDRHRG